jgi:hypothetical protein
MHVSRLGWFGIVGAAAAIAAGCAGGGGSGGGGTLPGTSHSSGTATQLALHIVVPSSGQSSAGRRPAYVASTIQSVVVLIANGGTSLTVGNNYANIAATSSACSASPTAAPTTPALRHRDTGEQLSCTITVGAAISSSGSYSVAVATYDAAQSAPCNPVATPACAGHLLSISTVPQQITLGSTTPLNIALGGVPTQFQPLEIVSGLIGGVGDNTHDTLSMYGPNPAVIEFELLDADGNIIAGPGSPVVTGTSSQALTIAVSPNPSGGTYTATFTPVTVSSAVGPVVQPTTVPLSVAISIPGTSVANQTVAVATLNIKHSVIYVGAPFAGSCNATSVYAFFDGNATAVMPSGFCTGTSAVALATDHNDGLWLADYGNNELLGWSAASQPISGAWSESYGVCGTGGCNVGSQIAPFTNPGGLTFDWSNNAYVSNVTGGSYEIWSFAAPSPTSTPVWSAASFTYPAAPTSNLVYEGLSVDAGEMTHLYAAQTNITTFTSAFGAFNVGTPSFLTIAGASQVLGTALDPSSNVWVLLNPGSGTEAELIDPATDTVLQTISVPSQSSGIAVDSAGTVYIAGGSSVTTVLEYKPPLYNATPGPAVANPATIAVVPNGLFGSNSQTGLQTPLPSPIPLPTFSGY